MRLTIVTYNIHHGAGMDRTVNVPRIAHLLRDTEADVACLQEIESRVPRSRFLRQPNELARLTQMRAVFGPALNWPLGGQFGNAILTRLPLESAATYPLPAAKEARGLVEARITTDAGPITVFATHWGLTDEDRLAQAEACAAYVRAAPGPILFAGDLNEGPDGPAQAILCAAGLERLNPPLPTFPAGDPEHAIDHVFGSPQWRVRDAHTIPSLASDHQPLVLELEWTP